MDFGENFIKWIKLIYTSNQAQIVVNGDLTKAGKYRRGQDKDVPNQYCYLFQFWKY